MIVDIWCALVVPLFQFLTKYTCLIFFFFLKAELEEKISKHEVSNNKLKEIEVSNASILTMLEQEKFNLQTS